MTDESHGAVRALPEYGVGEVVFGLPCAIGRDGITPG